MLPSLASLHGTIVPTSADTPLVIGPQPTPAVAPPAVAPPANSASGRFEVISAHARGGLGQVSVAHDKELHRQVALKEIHPRLADHPESRARFLLEAEVTGSLEHPGVVPVYSLGTWPDGRPYYAMRFVRGKSLEEAVAQFHELPCDADERELKLRKLLRRLIDVCNAVEYAHSRGVLHRDIKPANIMLGPYGETLVVDWGLAKPASHREDIVGAAESLLMPPSAGNTPATRAGSVIGTPAYMSPEQAVGALDLLRPASDVYSLGATLYTILTNRPAFEEGDFVTIRSRILTGDFLPPRAIRSAVPPALEAICLKAMSLEPGDRYASARQLAEDVENWLADAPVMAYREGWVERWSRWSRRHRSWSRAGAVSLIVVTVIAVLATWSVNRARLQTEEAHHQRALAQIELLCNAEPAAMPLILENLRPFHDEVAPRLREMAAGQDLSPEERLRINLALLDDEPGRLSELVGALLSCGDDDFPLVRDHLASQVARFADDLWKTLHDGGAPAEARFYAGLALASYLPDSPRWTPRDFAFISGVLLSEGLDRQRALRADAQPIASRLLPEIYRLFGDGSQSSDVRSAATAALAAWAGDRPELLATAVSEANAEQSAVLLPALATASDQTAVVRTLREIVGRQPPARGNISERERVALGRLRAGAAIALLRLGRDPALAELFKPADDPEGRTQFVAGLRGRGAEPGTLVACLDTAQEEAVRVGLIFAIGEFPCDAVPESMRDGLVQRLEEWYRTDPSSAVHAVCGWLLATWQHADRVAAIDREPHATAPVRRREWFNVHIGEKPGLGMVVPMIVFPAGDFLMGSPPTEVDRQSQETQHRVRLSRPFAMSSRPVCRALYHQFLTETRGHEAAQAYLATVQEMAPTPKHPAVGVNWYDAVLFARWLTTKIGMSESDQCYADPATLVLDAHGHPHDRQWPFYPERKGFRLPTEAEWEYACRAGTVTTFSFGSDQSLAGDYGWLQDNSAGSLHQSLSLRPTGRGLVSMHGNAGEWCHDWLGFIPGGADTDPIGAPDGSCRAMRGGSYLSVASLSRSASRSGLPPDFAAPYSGIRLVRTMAQ